MVKKIRINMNRINVKDIDINLLDVIKQNRIHYNG